MLYYISKNGQQLGPLNEDQGKAMLSEGKVTGDDLAILFGGTKWQPL